MAVDVFWRCVLLASLVLILLDSSTVQGQLNFYIAKNNVNSCLKLNYNMDLYMIKNDEPVSLLKDSRAFKDFLAPLSAKIDVVKLNWFSSPKTSRYHLTVQSSDTESMPHPVPSLAAEGLISHSKKEFSMSFGCTGRKAGLVEVSLRLNYTSVISGKISMDKMQSFDLVVRRWCDKTVSDPTPKSTSGGIHWSRAAIVGLCAGVTLVLCMAVGIGLLLRYLLRQRKLKMEFEDDLELTEKREYSKKKIMSLPMPSLSSQKKTPKVIYSPTSSRSSNKRHSSLPGPSRQRSITNVSDTSTAGLICLDDTDDEDQNQVQSVCKCESREQLVGGRASQESNPVPETTPHKAEILSEMMSMWSSQLVGYLVSKEQLEINELISQENVFNIYHGSLKMDSEDCCKHEVAVRILRDDPASDLETVVRFVRGAIAMKSMSHPNVLPLVGVVLHPTSLPYIITPYNRDRRLCDVLVRSRGSQTKPQGLTSEKLLDIAIQITRGMDSLTLQKDINLSTRNCLVSDDLLVRIDSHMDVNSSDVGGVSECLDNASSYEKKHVFLFGAILWEIITHGEKIAEPYQCRPANCPEELYDTLIKCRHPDPAERPTFSWLSDWLAEYQSRLFPGTLCFQTLHGQHTIQMNC
ncbi:tyrosine-protein kinase RYK [Nematostella vectensis]|uniref:tyrosine-protein kinase RYK n=1 Tax=Nematostella vectensis TaxID=45351 RepID=UPI0013904B65|nr:tyrosine-protein kinase RYK [Nematostella vectensis]